MNLLDTNIVSALFRASSYSLEQRFKAAAPFSLFFSSIVEAEVHYGIAKKRLEGTKLDRFFDQLLSKIIVLPWTSSTAKVFARLRADSEAAGVTLATVDLMIASSAKEHDLTLIT